MSKNRDFDKDRDLTARLINDQQLRDRYRNLRKNWLDHSGGAAGIDWDLLDGASMNQLEKHRGSVEQHLRHLRLDHGLAIDEAGLIRFQRAGGTSQSGATERSESPARNAGAGFGNPIANREVEQAAILTVSRHYRDRGWTVRSVETDKCGYDLECYKDGICEHVEVKGVGGLEESFIITKGELDRATSDPAFRLVVVTSALQCPTVNTYLGKELSSRWDLTPMQFRASVKSPGH